MNKFVVFIPVSDLELFAQWDLDNGWGGQNQLPLKTKYAEGILVRDCYGDEALGLVADFEAYSRANTLRTG